MLRNQSIQSFLIFMLCFSLNSVTANAANLKQHNGTLVVTQNNQVVENLFIKATGNSVGIHINGKSGVIIRNVKIEHEDAHGISLYKANNFNISNVEILKTNSPAYGPATAYRAPSHNSININDSHNGSITNLRAEKGSSGIYAVRSDGLVFDTIEAVDVRGNFPRGQVVQFNDSHNNTLRNFKGWFNPRTSYGEDAINVYNSNNTLIENGYIYGNTNTTNGVALLIEDGSNNTVMRNITIEKTGTGVNVAGGSSNSRVENIKFINDVPHDQLKAIAGPNARDKHVSSGGLAFTAWQIHGITKNVTFKNLSYCNVSNQVYITNVPDEVTFIGGGPKEFFNCPKGSYNPSKRGSVVTIDDNKSSPTPTTPSRGAPSITNLQDGATISRTQKLEFTKGFTNVTKWVIRAGSTETGNQYYDSGILSGNVTSHTLKNLPSGTVYVSLNYLANGKWERPGYKFTVGTKSTPTPPPGAAPSITNLKDGAMISRTQKLEFTKGSTNVTKWVIRAGSTKTGNQYYDSGILSGNVTSHTLRGLPASGTVYVTLNYLANGKWNRPSYTFKVGAR